MKVNMDQLTRQGIDAVRHGQTAEGRGYLEQAVKADPKNAIAELWLASIASDDTEHRRHLERVLELDPSHPFALRDLAELNGQPPPRPRHDTTAGAVASTPAPAAREPIATPPELRTMTPIAMAPAAVLQAIRETPLPSSSLGGPRPPAVPRPMKPSDVPAKPPIKPFAGGASSAPPPNKPASTPAPPAERGAATPDEAASAASDAAAARPTFARPTIAQKPGAQGEAGKMEDAPLWASLMTADDAVAIANRPRSGAKPEAGAPATAQPGDNTAGPSMVRTYESPLRKPEVRRPPEAPGRGAAIGAAGLAVGAAGMAAGAASAPAFGKPVVGTPSVGKPATGTPSVGKPAAGIPTFGSPAAGAPSGAVSAFERPPRLTPAGAGVDAEQDECDAATEADDETPARPMSRGRVALIVALLCAAFLIGALGRHLLGPRSQARGGDANPALSGALAPQSDTTAAEAGAPARGAEQPAADPQIEAADEAAAASEHAGTRGDEAQAPASSDEAQANGQSSVPANAAGGDAQASAPADDAQANGQSPAAGGDAQADEAAAGSQAGAAAETQPAPRDTAEEALGTAFLSGPSVTGADIDPLTVIPVWPEPFATTGASTCALPPASPALVLDIRVSANGERAFKIQYRECVGWVAEGYLSSTRGAAQELPADMRNAEPGK